jgi:hypothetical protein
VKSGLTVVGMMAFARASLYVRDNGFPSGADLASTVAAGVLLAGAYVMYRWIRYGAGAA